MITVTNDNDWWTVRHNNDFINAFRTEQAAKEFIEENLDEFLDYDNLPIVEYHD